MGATSGWAFTAPHGGCAAAHGGQVVLSQTTRELLHETPLEKVELRDLGEHRLKDLARRSGCTSSSSQASTPTSRRCAASRTGQRTSRAQPTPLVGREGEIAAVLRLLRQAEIRLVTLTGTGGTGKTRLAAQAAADLLDDFADGVFFVGLAALADPDLVLPTIAQTLGVRGSSALSASRRRCVTTSASEALLLVLDNFEHIIDAAPRRRARRERRPPEGADDQPRALPLRRARLPVPPLEPPDDHVDSRTLLEYEAVALFIERARAARRTSADPCERTRCRRDLQDARRASARDRARGRRGRGASPPRAAGAARQPLAGAHRRPTRPLRRASRRCATQSTGATTSSTPMSRRSSRGSRSFAGGCTLEAASTLRRGRRRPVGSRR